MNVATIHDRLHGLRAKANRIEAKLAPELDELERVKSQPAFTEGHVRQQQQLVDSLQSQLEPLRQRITELEAQLPSDEAIADAREREASFLESVGQLEVDQRAVLNDELIPALERAVEIAAKLNTAKHDRLELTRQVRQLRGEFNFGERNAHFIKFPECDGQKVAFLLATFLRESIYGLPSDALERDLAGVRKSVGV